MRILGVIQARMSSTRLPGKVLFQLGGETVLGRVIRATRSSSSLDDLVVATTTDASDDVVVEECERVGVAHHRGPRDDVLTRFLGAIERTPTDAVMRITADCPLLDPRILRTASTTFRGVPDLDYLSTGLVRTLPRGMDVEIISAEALRRIDALASDHHRVHVTSYTYSNPQEFALLGLNFLPSLGDLRLTLDTPADWDVIRQVVAAFGSSLPSAWAVAAWLADRPDIRELNVGVRQKSIQEG